MKLHMVIQRTQSKMLRNITSAPRFIRNKTIHNDLEIVPVTDVTLSQGIDQNDKTIKMN